MAEHDLAAVASPEGARPDAENARGVGPVRRDDGQGRTRRGEALEAIATWQQLAAERLTPTTHAGGPLGGADRTRRRPP